mmetsp:Transcript_4062/g.13665  ORF Transcript_4062/g.13665 Transcript_4062/m.13665 type:complete len:249 (-) Transcript_4062:94-840(-)
MDQVETEKRETRSKLPHENWNLAKFLAKYNTSDIYSTAQTPKGLSDEVFLLPPMNCGGFTSRLSSTVLWFSSGDTKSVIHNDGQHNFHCIFSGRKDWILWQPSETINTRAFGWIRGEEEAKTNPKFKDTYGTYVGLIDTEDVDTNEFPGWDTLKWWKLNMEAGDCAYIPARWFHFVEAPRGRSLTVHVWFEAGGKFDQRSCDTMEAQGHNTSEYLLRISDCTWGHEPDKPKKTKCKVRKPAPRKVDEL